VPERSYAHRSVVDKLGIKPGQAVVFDETAAPVDVELRRQVLERAGRAEAAPDEPVDIVLVGATHATDVAAVLRGWRVRLDPAGGIWLLTPKRGRPGYVDQRHVIAAGLASGLVDNKSISVSERTSGLRWVIRRRDRPRR
jgi:Protein of unknown function (DUF3052)